MFATTVGHTNKKCGGDSRIMSSAWNLKQEQFLRMVKIMLSVNFSIDDGFSVMI